MKYWRWDKVDDYEYRLKDENHQIKGYLIQDGSGDWVVRFFNDDIDGSFPNTKRLTEMDNAEHAIWQATLWINNQCNRIANSFHHIRDHLPSIHELAEEYWKPIGEDAEEPDKTYGRPATEDEAVEILIKSRPETELIDLEELRTRIC